MAKNEFLFSDDGQAAWRFERQTDFFDGKKKKKSPPKDIVGSDDENAKSGSNRDSLTGIDSGTENSKSSATSTTPPKKKRATASKKGAAPPTEFSVTGLMRLIKFTLADQLPGKIVLNGEISNYKRHGSGHLYFTIKDENAQIAAVMWRSGASKLKFDPADGMAVSATGRIDTYEPQGKIQFYVDKLEPSGVGALELAFRQLAEKLRSEGLFEAVHKKPLPKYPAVLGIVTSGTGAAIEDITRTLNRRFPGVRKLLYPVRVQGDGAADEVAEAIRELNRRRETLGGIDALIVGRGGGSIEDLWAFNEEAVARAIFASEIPVICGVGHEVDTTIADLVADVRAATPTAAAELAVPDREEVRTSLRHKHERLHLAVKRRYDGERLRLHHLANRPMFLRPTMLLQHPRQQADECGTILQRVMLERLRVEEKRLAEYSRTLRQIEPHAALVGARKRVTELDHRLQLGGRGRLQEWKTTFSGIEARLSAVTPGHRIRQVREQLRFLENRLNRTMELGLREREQRLAGMSGRLSSLNPKAVLQRGYSITRLKADGRIVGKDGSIHKGDIILTETAGQPVIESEVIGSSERQEPKSS